MTRVKRGVHATKRRRSILAKTKGYRFDRSKKERAAREALAHAGAHAFAHRRKKKGDFRRLFQMRINAAARPFGFSYSTLMHALSKEGAALDRKTLAALAREHPERFERLVKKLS